MLSAFLGTRKEGSGTDLYPVIPLFRLLLLQLLRLLLLLLLSRVVCLVTQETLVTKQGRHQAPGQVARGVGQLGDGGADVGGAKLKQDKVF